MLYQGYPKQVPPPQTSNESFRVIGLNLAQETTVNEETAKILSHMKTHPFLEMAMNASAQSAECHSGY